jgi:hypothetical protein
MVFDPSVYTEFRYLSADFSAEDCSFLFSLRAGVTEETHQFTERIAFTPVRQSTRWTGLGFARFAIMLGAVLG